MWFYAGNGWFFRREPQGIFRIIKISAEVTEPHPAATVVAEAELDGNTFVKLLAHLTQRSANEAHLFVLIPPTPS